MVEKCRLHGLILPAHQVSCNKASCPVWNGNLCDQLTVLGAFLFFLFFDRPSPSDSCEVYSTSVKLRPRTEQSKNYCPTGNIVLEPGRPGPKTRVPRYLNLVKRYYSLLAVCGGNQASPDLLMDPLPHRRNYGVVLSQTSF